MIIPLLDQSNITFFMFCTSGGGGIGSEEEEGKERKDISWTVEILIKQNIGTDKTSNQMEVVNFVSGWSLFSNYLWIIYLFT